jgi:hypothetical protein
VTGFGCCKNHIVDARAIARFQPAVPAQTWLDDFLLRPAAAKSAVSKLAVQTLKINIACI